jgi:hypothetical protein
VDGLEDVARVGPREVTRINEALVAWLESVVRLDHAELTLTSTIDAQAGLMVRLSTLSLQGEFATVPVPIVPARLCVH